MESSAGKPAQKLIIDGGLYSLKPAMQELTRSFLHEENQSSENQDLASQGSLNTEPLKDIKSEIQETSQHVIKEGTASAQGEQHAAYPPLNTEKALKFINSSTINDESILYILTETLTTPTLGYIGEFPATARAVCFAPRLKKSNLCVGLLVQLWHPGSKVEFKWGSHLLYDESWGGLSSLYKFRVISDAVWESMYGKSQVVEFASWGT
ncbi:MAG: hypothetical protein M1813_009706 [Trichoglossum hirsutum]|nr:MAG: hypothetical protein M1813_009706 [Trichoglossum hirsutum]